MIIVWVVVICLTFALNECVIISFQNIIYLFFTYLFYIFIYFLLIIDSNKILANIQ